MKFSTLLERVSATCNELVDVDPTVVERVVRETVRQMGFAVDNHGGVYSVAPEARPAWEMPEQQNVHWSNGRRRRR